jgi:hypothetical protein
LVPSPLNPALMVERGVTVLADLMPPFPEIESVVLPNAQIGAHLGDVIVLSGHHFDGTNQRLLLTQPRLRLELEIQPPVSITPTTATFMLPNQPANIPAGTYLMSLEVVRPGEAQPRTSNLATLTIAPQITTLTNPATVFDGGADGTAVVTIGCTPEVGPTQRASLLLGGVEVPANPHPNTTGTLTFTVLNAPIGTHRARLRVDGIDSQIVNRATTPPVFFEHWIGIS